MPEHKYPEHRQPYAQPRKMSEEWRYKRSEWMRLHNPMKRPEVRVKISSLLLGKPKSMEHRMKLSEALLGKPGTPHTAEWKQEARKRFLLMVKEKGWNTHPGWSPESTSWLERRFLKILGDARLVGFRHNYAVETSDGRTYYIDFAFPELMLGVEVDSKMYHSSESQIERDQYRQALLEEAGWTIVRFSSEDILRRPHEVKKRLKKTVEETGKKSERKW